MAILCKIKLHRPPNGIFTPNGFVSGVINYSVSEPLPVKGITLSLKGAGKLIIEEKHDKSSTYHTANEVYVSIDHNVLDEGIEKVIPTGSYEIPFKFLLPPEIPATLDFTHSQLNCNTRCRIGYFLIINFERPGPLTFARKFEQEIVVVRNNIIVPRHPTQLIVSGEKKKLFQFMKKNFINLKVWMPNSVIPPAGTVHLEYEVTNNSNLTIKSVEAKMMKMYIFTTRSKVQNILMEIPNVKTKSGQIASGQVEIVPISFSLPADALSLEGSEIVCRDYIILITVEIPWPHRNLVFKVPFQVGFKSGEGITESSHEIDDDDDDEPPSYWDAMGESKGDEG